MLGYRILDWTHRWQDVVILHLGDRGFWGRRVEFETYGVQVNGTSWFYESSA